VNGFYLGGSLGRSHMTDICQLGTECKSRDTEFSLLAGWQFNRFLAAETAYRDFGHASLNTGDIKAHAMELDAVGTIPVTGRFAVLGRLGVFRGTTKGQALEEKNSGATYGFGGQYSTSDKVSLRLEWQRYRDLAGGAFGVKTDIDSLSLGVVFRFD
jgi:OOP family OmpA-OmpF porin